jgi:peptidoglycan hydrolase-like protein with peptidoglycan-binding domain
VGRIDGKEADMRKITVPVLLAASLAIAAPARAQTDFGQIVSGLAQSLLTQELDKNAFADAQRQNTVAAYRGYLTKFPKGAYRGNAVQALAKLGAPVGTVKPAPPKDPTPTVQSAASIEASLGLTRFQRIEIQKQLTAIGYSTGVADGLWGANTRAAIARWQQANKLSATGYFTDPQVTLVARQAGAKASTTAPPTPAVDDPVEEQLLALSYAERREVQRRLTSLGYNTYGVDGSFGGNTRRALAAWQRDEGLRASGYLTADQLRTLRTETGG